VRAAQERRLTAYPTHPKDNYMNRRLCRFAIAVVSLRACWGQQPDPPQPAASAPAARPWSIGGIDFSGLIDGYYS